MKEEYPAEKFFLPPVARLASKWLQISTDMLHVIGLSSKHFLDLFRDIKIIPHDNATEIIDPVCPFSNAKCESYLLQATFTTN